MYSRTPDRHSPTVTMSRLANYHHMHYHKTHAGPRTAVQQLSTSSRTNSDLLKWTPCKTATWLWWAPSDINLHSITDYMDSNTHSSSIDSLHWRRSQRQQTEITHTHTHSRGGCGFVLIDRWICQSSLSYNNHRSITTQTSRATPTGNESVPIQLAQCWFPGLAISNAQC